MTGAARTAPGAGAGTKLCRCGHLPTHHMSVVPMGSGGDGNWRLEPSGPCERCGKDVCPRFRPDGPRTPP